MWDLYRRGRGTKDGSKSGFPASRDFRRAMLQAPFCGISCVSQALTGLQVPAKLANRGLFREAGSLPFHQP
jgi:hypothetical protein